MRHLLTLLLLAACGSRSLCENDVAKTRREIADLVVLLLDSTEEKQEVLWVEINQKLDALKVVAVDLRLATLQAAVEEFRPSKWKRVETFLDAKDAAARNRTDDSEKKLREEREFELFKRGEWPPIDHAALKEAKAARRLLFEIHFAQKSFIRRSGHAWTRDISGLFRAKHPSDAIPLQLISVAVANSDAKPCAPLDSTGVVDEWSIVALQKTEESGFRCRMIPGKSPETYAVVCALSLPAGERGRCFLLTSEGDIRYLNDVTDLPEEIPACLDQWKVLDRVN